jgi:hypothetical protein
MVMAMFWMLAVLMVLAALAFVLPPLLRPVTCHERPLMAFLEMAKEGFAVKPPPTASVPKGQVAVTVVFAPGSGGAMTGTLKVTSATGQATEVSLSAQAETVSANQGAGALGIHWLVLLALAIAALWWPRLSSLNSLSKESSR